MSIFIQPTLAPKARVPYTANVAVLLAGIFVLIAVAQLFSFEELPAVIERLRLPGVGPVAAVLVAALIVVAEVLAVPFLLRMRLSPAMRYVSMVSGWLAVLWWLVVAFWQNVAVVAGDGLGVLGETIHMPVGWWMVLLAAGLCGLVACVSWGLWPARRHVS